MQPRFRNQLCSYRGHGDERPPVGVHHGGELGLSVVLLKDVGQGGEDEHAHRQEEHEEAQLFVAVAQGETQALQAHGVTGELEYSGAKNGALSVSRFSCTA